MPFIPPLHVFSLLQNRFAPMGEETVLSKSQLTFPAQQLEMHHKVLQFAFFPFFLHVPFAHD